MTAIHAQDLANVGPPIYRDFNKADSPAVATGKIPLDAKTRDAGFRGSTRSVASMLLMCYGAMRHWYGAELTHCFSDIFSMLALRVAADVL